MKIAIVLCAVIGVSLALPSLNYGKNVNTGRSQVSRSDDGHGNYEFAYDEEHHEGGTSRREKGGKGWQTGSYELRDRDGRKRTVKYVADAHGFRANVDTNEPGTDDKQDPADVDIDVRGQLRNLDNKWDLPSAKVIIQREEPRLILSKAEPTLLKLNLDHRW